VKNPLKGVSKPKLENPATGKPKGPAAKVLGNKKSTTKYITG
jgi:hypothetical protein